MSRTIVVVPCYNEADRLDPEAFRARAARSDSLHFLFVDDGSTDRTREILEKLVESDPERLGLLALPRNVGKAEAVRLGLLEAFKAEPSFVGFWDADLATPLEDIELFREILERRPRLVAVFGSRVNLLGRSVRRNLMRHYVGRVFATCVCAVLRLAIYDTQCGAKLFRATREVEGLFAEPFESGWIFDVEIIARLIRSRRETDLPPVSEALYEHPLMVWHDVAGSKVRLRDFPRAARALASIYLRYMRA